LNNYNKLGTIIEEKVASIDLELKQLAAQLEEQAIKSKEIMSKILFKKLASGDISSLLGIDLGRTGLLIEIPHFGMKCQKK
jgi:hypothetical protein